MNKKFMNKKWIIYVITELCKDTVIDEELSSLCTTRTPTLPYGTGITTSSSIKGMHFESDEPTD